MQILRIRLRIPNTAKNLIKHQYRGHLGYGVSTVMWSMCRPKTKPNLTGTLVVSSLTSMY